MRNRNFTKFVVYATICGIFSNYIGKIDQFTLDLFRRSDTLDHPKEDHNKREFKP